MNKRRLKMGGYSLAITALIIAGIILLNAAAGLLAERFGLKIDLTPQSLYELAEETRTVLSEMNEDVTLTVLANEEEWQNSYSLYIAEAVRNYAALSGGHIRLRFLDPDTNPQLAEEYPLLKAINTYDIIVESARRYTSVASDDMMVRELDYTTYSYQITGLQIDQTLTTALMYVLSETAPKAVFAQNHGESFDERFLSIFEMLSYSVEYINLATEEIPADTSFLVFSKPSFDISLEESYKLDNFRIAGGDIVLIFASDMPKLTNLELFIGEWGISLGSEIVMHDTNSSSLDRSYLYATASTGGFSDLEAVSYLTTSNPNVPIYAGSTRPIYSLWAGDQKSENNKLYRLISTDGAAYLSSGGAKIEGTEDSYTLAMLNHKYDYVDNVVVDSYLLALNAGILSDMELTYSQMNAYFTAYLLNDLNPAAEGIYIPSKSLSSTPLTVAAWQSQLVFALLVVIIPLLIAALGILTWRRRKAL